MINVITQLTYQETQKVRAHKIKILPTLPSTQWEAAKYQVCSEANLPVATKLYEWSNNLRKPHVNKINIKTEKIRAL